MSSFRIIEHSIPCQHIREYPRALANKQEDTLYLAVKQYIPLDNVNPQPGDVTIIGAHANGFPKELYEPLWDDLLSRAKKQNWRIRSIWIADVAHQGNSSVLNENLLGNDPSWFDHTRDLLNLINTKRDDMPRPLVGIGHSMGGCQLVNLALIHPRLLTALILLDPVIQDTPTAQPKPGASLSTSIVALSTFRRSTWPSRQNAAESFLKSPFYRAWDRRVFDRWVEHGLREMPTLLEPDSKSPAVTLTTPVAHEVHTFLRPNYNGHGNVGQPQNRQTHPDADPKLGRVGPLYRAEPILTYARLPEVRPPVLYIFGGISDVGDTSLNEKRIEITGSGVGGSGGVKEGRVKGVTLEGIGHLVAMEAVEQVADSTSEWLGPMLEQWRQDEKPYDEWTKKQTLKEKQEVDERWKNALGGPPKRRNKESKI